MEWASCQSWQGQAACTFVSPTFFFVGDASSGDSDSDLPQVILQTSKDEQIVIVVPDDPSPTPQLPAFSDRPSTSGTTSQPDANIESLLDSNSETESLVGSPAL